MSEVERDGIRDVSGGSNEAEQRGIRAAKRGERENVSNMNERSEYRNQNAEAPTTSAFDAPQVPRELRLQPTTRAPLPASSATTPRAS